MVEYMAEKTIWDGIVEYMEDNGFSLRLKDYFAAWPVIAGYSLSSCTELKKVDEKNGKIYVYPTSSSARSLLSMQKKRIIKSWNEQFSDFQIKDIVITRS